MVIISFSNLLLKEEEKKLRFIFSISLLFILL